MLSFHPEGSLIATPSHTAGASRGCFLEEENPFGRKVPRRVCCEEGAMFLRLGLQTCGDFFEDCFLTTRPSIRVFHIFIFRHQAFERQILGY